MAIAFARVSYHSRAKGHSAVAGAAYRSGEKLIDERTGETHNFQNRHDVIYTELLLPESADSELSDRATLWNAVEQAENRKNSQVAKDFILALPRDLDSEHHIVLARQFTQHHFVRQGLVADIAIHDHGDGNPHAHIYVTTRRLKGRHFARHKARDLEPDVVRGRVVQPEYWGKQWRDFQNTYFKEQGMPLAVDAHYILSQRHEGRIRGQKNHYLKEENRLRREASINIAVHDPESVLTILGQQHAVFSKRDIACLLHKNTDTLEQFQDALLRLQAHRDLISLGPGDDGRDRYTTRANYEREAAMGDSAKTLYLQSTHRVSQRIVNHCVRTFTLNEEQALALDHIANSGDICAVVGRAGTGKSYMMNAAREMWQRAGYQVHGVALSGIAAQGLESGSGIPSTTLHSVTTRLLYGSLTLTKEDVLVMDEAGMTDLNDMALIVDAVRSAGAKLVLVGDSSQLQPIGPGAPFRAVVEQIGFAELNQIQRQVNGGDRHASIALSRGMVGSALDHYWGQQHIHLVDSPPPDEEDDDGGDGSGALSHLVRSWIQNTTPKTLHQRLILAHRHCDVDALNRHARQMMSQQGYLGTRSFCVRSASGDLELAVGERLLFLRNHPQMGISNGQFSTIEKIHRDQITVTIDGHRQRQLTFSTHDYPYFNYGYAATVHKSQGVTVDETYVYVGGRAWNRFLTYVAMTRHRLALHLFADQSQFPDLNALKKVLSRDGLKDTVLDWPISYAIRRGFDPDGIIGRFIDRVTDFKQSIKDKWLFVVNYEAYLQSQSHRDHLRTRQEQRTMARHVAAYVDLQRSVWLQWRQLKKESHSYSHVSEHPHYSRYYQERSERNRLAHTLYQERSFYDLILTQNSISMASLRQFSYDHQRYSEIKRFYPDIAELSSDWNRLYQHQRRYCQQHRDTLQRLSTDQRRFYRLVDDYRQARIDAGIGWSALFKDKEKDHTISDARWQFALQLAHTRNRLAYSIVLNSDACATFLQTTSLPLSDIEQHASSYSRPLQDESFTPKINKTPSSSVTTPTDNVHYFRYGVVNDALVAMGEDFYTTVLDHTGKRSGHTLRFGRKGSLSVNTKGQHAGTWHSFETGNGGGPIQFLMDTEHGWGLIYVEAIKEGARIAGLSEHDATLITRRKPAKTQAQREFEAKHIADDVSKKIASARYYYLSARSVDGTIGELYLRETRRIQGDLSEFRYHSRIRDDVFIKDHNGKDKQITTYHPGLVVAARNRDGEIVATQTIILNSTTMDKVDHTTVGVVKRSRGQIKGSAVLIHQGTSHKVIIAEGPETAASLIAAEPDAHIYVTLGNVKNATHLGWLAEKHHTDNLVFAVDKDRHTQNLNALKEVAQTLKYEHNIDSYMAIPHLPDRDQYDFNDLLKEKGIHAVKEQLAHTQKIIVPQRCIILDENTIHERIEKTRGNLSKSHLNMPSSIDPDNETPSPIELIQDDRFEWDVLASIDHNHAHWLSQYRELALQKSDEKEIIEVYQSMQKHMRLLSTDQKAIYTLQEKAPKLAHLILQQEKTRDKNKPFEIDWQSPQYRSEWKNLRQIDDQYVQWMVKFYDLSKAKHDKKEMTSLNRSITNQAEHVVNNKHLYKKVLERAPRLAKTMQSYIKSFKKDKGMDRE